MKKENQLFVYYITERRRRIKKLNTGIKEVVMWDVCETEYDE